MTIEEMKEKRREIQEQMKQHSWSNPDHAEVLNGLQQEEADINEQIRQAQTDVEDQQVEEGKKQALDTVRELEIEDEKINQLIELVIEDNTKTLQKKYKQELEELSSNHNQEIQSWHKRNEQLIAENEELNKSIQELRVTQTLLDERNTDLFEELEKERGTHQESIDRLTEVDQNRKNAVGQLEEKDIEIERLRSHIEDLQQDLANAPAPKTAIDVTPTMKELAKDINKKYTSVTPINNAGLYYDAIDEDGVKTVLPKKEAEQIQEKGLVMPSLGTSFRVRDADSEEGSPTDETRIITVDEKAEISEGEQGSNFPSTESQGTDQVGPDHQGAYEVDKARYATRQELQAVKDDLYSFKRSIDDQFGTTFVKAG